MRTSSALFTFALCTAASTSAQALGSFGVRLGTGMTMSDPEPKAGAEEPKAGAEEPTPIVAGLAYRIDLIVVGVEADLLFHRFSFDKVTEDRLALPVIVNGSLPLVPGFVALNFGAGLEPRFLIGADDNGADISDDRKSMVMYLPISVGAELDLQVVKGMLDIRYERQLTPHFKGKPKEDDRAHEVLVMAGVFL